MLSLIRNAVLLVILSIVVAALLSKGAATSEVPSSAQIIPNPPVQTDDGLDPITLIFTGYAPSWWVATNIAGWSDSAYCSGPKAVNGNPYNSTLEHPDFGEVSCFGPRDHIRIWDMGNSPIFGRWSIGSAHHEHTVCDPFCHHIVDSWERAQADVRSSFVAGKVTQSISNYTQGNKGYYQGVYNDGNATLIQLKPPSQYPVVFQENGLSNQTNWSVAMNGTTLTSSRPDITFSEPNGTYVFIVSLPDGYNASRTSGSIRVAGDIASQIITFKPRWSTSSVAIYASGNPITINLAGNATVTTSSIRLVSSGITSFSFTTTEIGSRGVLNVTIPKSAVSSDSSAFVYVDSLRNDDAKMTDDPNNYYVYFPLTYGTHSVVLQFLPSATSYLQYIVLGSLAAASLTVLFSRFKAKQKGEQSRFPLERLE